MLQTFLLVLAAASAYGNPLEEQMVKREAPVPAPVPAPPSQPYQPPRQSREIFDRPFHGGDQFGGFDKEFLGGPRDFGRYGNGYDRAEEIIVDKIDRPYAGGYRGDDFGRFGGHGFGDRAEEVIIDRQFGGGFRDDFGRFGNGYGYGGRPAEEIIVDKIDRPYGGGFRGDEFGRFGGNGFGYGGRPAEEIVVEKFDRPYGGGLREDFGRFGGRGYGGRAEEVIIDRVDRPYGGGLREDFGRFGINGYGGRPAEEIVVEKFDRGYGPNRCRCCGETISENIVIEDIPRFEGLRDGPGRFFGREGFGRYDGAYPGLCLPFNNYYNGNYNNPYNGNYFNNNYNNRY